MQTYISLLRGINVGGNNKIKMADLKAMYESLGYEMVTSYIQSGNVVFRSRKKKLSLLEKEISAAIKSTFDLDVKVLLRTKKDFENLLIDNPFKEVSDEAQKQIYFFFLSEEPEAEQLSKLMVKIADMPEDFEVKRTHAFLNAVNGFGKTKLNGGFVERNLKVDITARNWRTVNILLAMATKIEEQ